MVKHFRSKIQIRNRSRNAPETLSERILNAKFRTAGDPQALENNAYLLSRKVSEVRYPQYGWYRFLFWRGSLQELVM